MRKLRFRCPRCEDVVVSAGEIVLTSASGPARYHFRCPVCGSVVVERCSELITRLLLLSGARTAPPAAGRPVLGPGHVEELHRLLERPDWLNLL